MSTLKTFRLWLEPDQELPMFKRLAWEKVDVSIRDVLMGGVHPWTENKDGTDVHPSLIEAFVQKLNKASAKVAELVSFGFGIDVLGQQGNYYDKITRFERTLAFIHKNVYFVDDLTYLQLLDIAKRRLRDSWSHAVARRLAEWACSGFQELRQFLKAKDKTIKLSGYDDIGQYDLGEILSLDDFQGRDSSIILEAIPSLNFRRASCLDDITDSQGRLRLVPDIRKVTLTLVTEASDDVHLLWHVERNGKTCRFRPEIGTSDAKRRKAAEFAERYRTDEGKLCFTTSMDRLSEMIEQRAVVPSFPALNYTFESKGPIATATVLDNRVPAFFIGRFHDKRSNGEMLKEILRKYGMSMTGNKQALLKKLAKLAAKQYEERRPEMDAFFSEQPFVRINAVPTGSERLPLLQDAPLLRSLLLTMYTMKHLRGNAILDVAHDNNTYTEEQLAHALLMEKVALSGAFLRRVV